jgi:hypothetical protein
MTKAGIYNKRVNGKMRRVQINAKGQWKFLKGKPRARPAGGNKKPKRSGAHKSHKPKHHKKGSKRRSRGWLA